MPRFFVSKNDISLDTIILTDENAAHIAKVLRLEVNDKIIVCDGERNDYYCRINKITKNKAAYEVQAEIEKKCVNLSEPSINITLFQGLPKADKMDIVVQKSVELGVFKIVPVVTERTIMKWDKKNAEKTARLQKIAEAAAKQSDRGIIPEIGNVAGLDEAIEQAKTFDKSFVAYENEKAFMLKSYLSEPGILKARSLGVFIGPEGGFSDEEIFRLRNAGIPSVSLGNRILRTETAGIITMAIVLYQLEGKL